MAFLLVWAYSAENRLESIYNYYCQRENRGIARKIISEIILEAQKLTKNPFIGQKELNLRGRKNEYRYVICKKYKIIYYVPEDENVIFIVDVFDSRQDPKKMHRS